MRSSSKRQTAHSLLRRLPNRDPKVQQLQQRSRPSGRSKQQQQQQHQQRRLYSTHQRATVVVVVELPISQQSLRDSNSVSQAAEMVTREPSRLALASNSSAGRARYGSRYARRAALHLPPSASIISIPVQSKPNLNNNNNEPNQMELIKAASRAHNWHWNDADKSYECLVSDDKLEVCIHPQCSDSAAAIRGSEPLKRNGNYYYWELTALDKTYGTSVMFGLCTKQQSLHATEYCNLIGLDNNGWSLSHKGLIWHNGKNAHYTQMFPTDQTITIGLLFNTMRGELSYFMDGKNLGVAFCGLNDTTEELYPVIGSTAKCTRIRLTAAYCGYVSLMERSCFSLLKHSTDRTELIRSMYRQQVPRNLITYMAEAAEVCASQTEITAQPDHCTWSVNQQHQQQQL